MRLAGKVCIVIGSGSGIGRMGTPAEIAGGILFLARHESRFATGSILTVDGGMTAR